MGILFEILALCHLFDFYCPSAKLGCIWNPDSQPFSLSSSKTSYVQFLYSHTMFNKSLRVQAPPCPSFSQNMQSGLRPLLNIQHFNMLFSSSSTTTTFLNFSMYSHWVSFFPCVILLSDAMVVGCHFLVVNWAVKASCRSFNECIPSSGRVLYHVMADPVRVNAKRFQTSLVWK